MTDGTAGPRPGSTPEPGGHPHDPDQEPTGPVIRDKRRFDENGDLREPGSTQEPAEATPEPEAPSADAALAAERLADLQRVQAEYINYKKRVDRDREAQRDAATARVIEPLLPVLDDIYLAKEHGELTGSPFEKISDKLSATLGRLGLTPFGAVGDAFDPREHEALMHIEADVPEGSEGTTVVQVMQPGYRLHDRIIRPARVAVADPS